MTVAAATVARRPDLAAAIVEVSSGLATDGKASTLAAAVGKRMPTVSAGR